MRIIKIESNDNGSHNNQSGGLSTVPEGRCKIWQQILILIN